MLFFMHLFKGLDNIKMGMLYVATKYLANLSRMHNLCYKPPLTIHGAVGVKNQIINFEV